MMERLSLVFKALSDPLRLRIVRQLLRNGKEAYGEELARALGIPAYRLSRHLKVLKITGLVHERRSGRWVYYSLANRNGRVLELLRRLIDAAGLPATSNGGQAGAGPSREGDGRQATRPPRQRRAGTTHRGQTLAEQEGFDWNQGPAIAGVL